jgi:hypothetical protein
VHNSKNLDITFELCEHGYSSGQGNFVTPTLHRHSSHILLTKNAVFQSRLGPHSLIFGHPASRAVPSSSTQEIFKGRCPLQPFCCHHFANSKAKHQITYNIYNSIKLLIFPSIWLVIYRIHCSENHGSLTKSAGWQAKEPRRSNARIRAALCEEHHHQANLEFCWWMTLGFL